MMKTKRVISEGSVTGTAEPSGASELPREKLAVVNGAFALGPPPIHQTPTPGVSDGGETSEP